MNIYNLILKGEKMWIAYLTFAIGGLASLACIIVGAYLAGYQKAKKEKIKELSKILWVIGGLVLLTCVLVFWFITWETARRTAARWHLNEPITSEMQLYGYKILEKRHFKEKLSADAPEKSRYFIDIMDLLPNYCGVFVDVEVSEEIYKDAEKGKSYLPEGELNEPTPQEPNEPVKQKAETNVSAFLIQDYIFIQ